MMAGNRWLFLFFLFCTLECSGFTASSQTENSAFNRFIHCNDLKHSSYGLKIVDLSTGKETLSYNKDLSLCPASTLKLLTTATALEVFGSDFRYKTNVYTDGTIDKDGTLNGNIYIDGVGDPTLGSRYLYSDPYSFLSDWTDSLKNEGIKTVKGSVIALDGLFGYRGVSPRWTWEDLGNYYGTGAYGISVFDDTYTIYFKSGRPGSETEIVDVKPAIKGLKLDNHVIAADNNADNSYIYGGPFSYDRAVYGSIPANRSAFAVKGSLPDPGFLLASVFTDNLRANGIEVKGVCTTSRLNPVSPLVKKILASFVSYPLSDIISVTNHVSNNHYAQHLFLKLGEAGYGVDGIEKFWKDRGIDMEGSFLYDGNGLSLADGLSAGILTDILTYMNDKGKNFPVFYDSFPVAGENGTVKNFLKGTSLQGKARVKSGSIEDVQSFAGYLNKNGKSYAFALIVNKFTGSRTSLRKEIESLLIDF